MFTRTLIALAVTINATIGVCVSRAQGDCTPTPEPTFTVTFPKLGNPPDNEGQGWDRPAVWAGHPGATDDSIIVPNGRPIYALFVSGYARNAYLDEVTFYNFARELMNHDAYVHFAWWNNLLAPYMERPLHYSQSHPGTNADLTDFANPDLAADKAVPGEDYQFVADAARLLRAIRANNPEAIIIVAGHSMGGGSIVHLAQEVNDVLIDILAPIDPVGNRNYPWAGPLYQNASHYNWTRWRVSRNNFLGYRSRRLLDGCDPSGPWLANINDAVVTCPAGVVVHEASRVRFASNIINLHHRWQHESLFPFDYEDTYSFLHSRPPGGSTSQSAVTTRAAGSDPDGWPSPNFGGTCCPVGVGVCWPTDGHGEVVGFRGPGSPQPLGVRVKTSPNCNGCPDLTWPARTRSNGTWGNGNSSQRRTLFANLESLPLHVEWTHEPAEPALCLVSPGLISLFNSMNEPPVADAGPDQTITCDGCSAVPVTLDGSASADSDNDALEYRWTWPFGSAAGELAHINLPVGTHCITLQVEDPSGHVAQDIVAVTVNDPSAAIVPYTSLAAAWQEAAGSFEARAFDEFHPGVPDALGCLLQPPTQPAVLQLAHGTLTVTALDTGLPVCAIRDGSTPSAVSDAYIVDAQSLVDFEFNPPVTAFYTFFGSLEMSRTVTMALYDRADTHIESITTPPSSHSSQAAGQGFTSRIPVHRIRFTSTEPGAVLIGAFVGLRSGEQSLGTINLGNYEGPGGSGVIQLDFACTFDCPADFDNDGFLTGLDFDSFVTAFEAGNPSADFDADGFITGLDFDAFVAAFEAGC